MRHLKTNDPDTHPDLDRTDRTKHEYMSKEIAAELLNLSPRRVLELADEGKIRRHECYNPASKRRQTVLMGEDVRRLVGERRGTMAIVPLGAATPPQPAAPPQLPALEAAPNALWLTIEEAERISGLPADHLAEAIDAGELPARDVGIRRGVRGRWRVKRTDLEALEGAKRARSAGGPA